MDTVVLPRDELREIIREAVSCALIENEEVLENAVSEALLDMKLGMAIEEGDVGEYVAEEMIMSRLEE